MIPSLTLAASGWLISLLAFGFVLVCLFMMLVILIQKPKGGGLSGAFGGAGGGNAQAAFGAKVGDVLTWLTVSCFVLFLLLAMGLTWVINPTVAGQNPGSAQPPLSQTLDEQTPEPDSETETPASEDATEALTEDAEADAEADAEVAQQPEASAQDAAGEADNAADEAADTVTEEPAEQTPAE